MNWILSFDGYCEPNPGNGGYGYVLVNGTKELSGSGANPETTNNRMEIMGLLIGLEKFKSIAEEGDEIQVIGDSEYVLNSAAFWMLKWKRTNYKKNKVKNRDLFERLDLVLEYLRGKSIVFNWWWIRGHTGFWINEKCDYLASLLVNNVECVDRHFEKTLDSPKDVDFSQCKLILKELRPKVI